MNYIFRRNTDIGSLDAYVDRLLLNSFVDKGDLNILLDSNNPKCILLGRSGVGKSALIKFLENQEENCIRIHPGDISIRHLSNSDIITYFKKLDIKLDLFYKMLWKHVFIVELIKLYFDNKLENSNRILDWFKGRYSDNKKKQKAIDYLTNWEHKFWEDTEYRIKEIESSLENRFKDTVGGDAKIKDLLSISGQSEEG